MMISVSFRLIEMSCNRTNIVLFRDARVGAREISRATLVAPVYFFRDGQSQFCSPATGNPLFAGNTD
jgi:hypothetical protein